MKLKFQRSVLVEKDVNAGKRLNRIDEIVAELTDWVNANTNRIEVKPGNSGFYVIPANNELFSFNISYDKDDSTISFWVNYDTAKIYSKEKFDFDDLTEAFNEAVEECSKHFITGNEKVLREFKDPGEGVLGKTGLFQRIKDKINRKAVEKEEETDLNGKMTIISNKLESLLKGTDLFKATKIQTTTNGTNITSKIVFGHIISVLLEQTGLDATQVGVSKIYNVLYPTGKSVDVKHIESFMNLLKETLTVKPNLESVKAAGEEEKSTEETSTEETKETEASTEAPKEEETTSVETTSTEPDERAKFKKMRAQARKDINKVDYKEFINAFAKVDLKNKGNQEKIIQTILSMYPTRKK